jgi:hypothetical protein
MVRESKPPASTVVAARLHNSQLPIAKLPTEIRRQIISEVLRSNICDGLKFKDTITEFDRAKPEMLVNRINILNRQHEYLKAKRRKAMVAARAKRSTRYVALCGCASSPSSRRSNLNYYQEFGIGKSQELPITESSSLLTVDSQIFFPIAKAILITEKEWSVGVSAKGVDFMDLPLIARLSDFKAQQSRIFEESDGIVRFKELRNLVFDIYAPTHGSREEVLSMFRNVQFLAKILQEEQRVNKNHHIVHLTVNIRSILPNHLKPVTPISIAMATGHIGAMQAFADPDFRNTSVSNGWFVVHVDDEKRTVRYEPAISTVHETLALDIVTMPLRRLRHIVNVNFNIPEAIADLPKMVKFCADFEAELMGNSRVDSSRELLMEPLLDAFDELLYHQNIQRLSVDFHNQAPVRRGSVSMDWKTLDRPAVSKVNPSFYEMAEKNKVILQLMETYNTFY